MAKTQRLKTFNSSSTLKEKDVEAYLVKRCKESGLYIVKLNPQGCDGIPDRLVMDLDQMNSAKFVELKIPKGGVLSAKQKLYCYPLNVSVIKNYYEVETFLMMNYPSRYKRPLVEVNEV